MNKLNHTDFDLIAIGSNMQTGDPTVFAVLPFEGKMTDPSDALRLQHKIHENMKIHGSPRDAFTVVAVPKDAGYTEGMDVTVLKGSSETLATIDAKLFQSENWPRFIDVEEIWYEAPANEKAFEEWISSKLSAVELAHAKADYKTAGLVDPDYSFSAFIGAKVDEADSIKARRAFAEEAQRLVSIPTPIDVRPISSESRVVAVADGKVWAEVETNDSSYSSGIIKKIREQVCRDQDAPKSHLKLAFLPGLPDEESYRGLMKRDPDAFPKIEGSPPVLSCDSFKEENWRMGLARNGVISPAQSRAMEAAFERKYEDGGVSFAKFREHEVSMSKKLFGTVEDPTPQAPAPKMAA